MKFSRTILYTLIAAILCAGSISAGKVSKRARKPVTLPPTLAVSQPTKIATVHEQPKPASKELLRNTIIAAPARSIFPQPKANRPRVRRVVMEVTAYCPCKKCCGPKAAGITASGKHVSYNNGKFVAADTDRLPFGSKVIIPGYGASAAPVEVIDRGGAIKGNKLDVFFPTHKQALEWGRKRIAVLVVVE